MPLPQAGQAAPELSLPSHNGDVVTLADLKGHNVVVAFYPLAFTPV